MQVKYRNLQVNRGCCKVIWIVTSAVYHSEAHSTRLARSLLKITFAGAYPQTTLAISMNFEKSSYPFTNSNKNAEKFSPLQAQFAPVYEDTREDVHTNTLLLHVWSYSIQSSL